MKTVYFFAVDSQGRESDPISISLGEGGQADISGLPSEMQRTLIRLGIPNAMHAGLLFPKDGEKFLEALLETANSAWRFRSDPQKLF